MDFDLQVLIVYVQADIRLTIDGRYISLSSKWVVKTKRIPRIVNI